jgi:hypothetical protein
MSSNPWLERLGFSSEDRVMILHTDDVGMCQASLDAYRDLLDFGLISTASTMVPAPWFPGVVELVRDYEGELDLGVHLTLTSEWSRYRWGPVSTRDPDSGLLDAQGYLPQTRKEIAFRGKPEAVRQEIEGQIAKALDAGIDVTHVDTHMGTAFNPDYARAYVEVALSHRIPPLVVRFIDPDVRRRVHMAEVEVSEDGVRDIVAQIRALEARGVPLLDRVMDFPHDQPGGELPRLKEMLETLPPGLTYMINHAAKDTPELRAITPDWRGRVTDYRLMTSPAVRAVIKESGVHVVGWRDIRDTMRDGWNVNL